MIALPWQTVCVLCLIEHGVCDKIIKSWPLAFVCQQIELKTTRSSTNQTVSSKIKLWIRLNVFHFHTSFSASYGNNPVWNMKSIAQHKFSFVSALIHLIFTIILRFQAYLRPFREHHIDPTSITRHDFFETNGDNFMAAIPILAYVTHIFVAKSSTEIQEEYPICAYLYLCSIFVALTNQVR